MKLSRIVLFFAACLLALPLSGCVATGIVIDAGFVGQNRPVVVKVTITMDSAPTQPFTQPVTVTASNGATCNATLDAKATGTCTLPGFPVSQKYTIKATWPGEGVHTASEATTTVQVLGAGRPSLHINREVTMQTFSPGGFVELKLELWDILRDFPSSVPVTVDVQGIKVCTLPMGASPYTGTCKFNAPLASGHFLVKATFPGDNLYLPASATYDLNVAAFALAWDITYNGQAIAELQTVPGAFEINKPYAVGVKLADPSLAGLVKYVTFEVMSGKGTGCTITSVTSTCNITFTSMGKLTVRAGLAPTTSLYQSLGHRVVFDIPLYTTTTTISTSPRTTLTGQSTTVTVSVTGQGPTPTGVVTVSGASGCTITLVNGSGSCQLSFNAALNHTLTANYPGDSVHASSTAQTVHRVELPPATSSCTGEGC